VAAETTAASTGTAPATSAAAQAARLLAPRRTDTRRIAIPQPGPRQVRLRLEGCGVCASSLPVWEGRPWFSYPLEFGAPGHEPWGRVDALGSGVTEFARGERVTGLSYRAFANYDLAAADHLVRLPPELDGVPVPGEPLGCAMNIVERSRIRPGESVAVIGAGFLGCLIVGLASAAGASVVATSRRAFALHLARRCGAAEVLPWPAGPPGIAAVAQAAGEGRFDCVVEATGMQPALDLATLLAGERGRIVVAGYHQDGHRSVDMQSWNWKGIDVISAHERDPARYVSGIEAAVAAMLDGRLDPLPLLTHRVGLASLNDAFALLHERPDGFLKAYVVN
jgi:threonine dehydrogenase-like Zn-dependent dehydrogenase